MVGLEVHLVSFEESDIYLKPNIHITYHTVADLPSKSFHHDEPYLQSHIVSSTVWKSAQKHNQSMIQTIPSRF